MRSKSRRSTKLSRRRNNTQSYSPLEARNLLATLVDVDQAAGLLTIRMDDHKDTAVVGINADGNVTVNGSHDLDNQTLGYQTLAAKALNDIVIEGNSNLAGQLVTFNNDFGGDLSVNSVKINDVNQVTINGVLEIDGDLDVHMTGIGGRIGDSISGKLVVAGRTSIDAGSNTIGLNNFHNDFNTLEVKTLGVGLNAVVSDANDIVLTGVQTSGDFILTAGGSIEDAQNTFMDVQQDATFAGTSVTLGDHAGDSTNFFRSAFFSTGHVDVQEDSNIVLNTSDVGSMTLRSVGAIYDGLRTNINVHGHVQLFGDNRVRIGEGGLDVFNAGSVEFRSNGHVSIGENSNTVITGTNSASSLNVNSWGRVADFTGTKINVDYETGFEGISVVIGDSAADTFNTGSLHFWTQELFQVTEDSSTHIIESKNRAGEVRIESGGAITDADNARVTVDGVARFTASSVNVGDTHDDWFAAGSVNFDTVGQFKLSENGNLQITGDNKAARTVINSSGNISNVADAKVNVRNSAAFFGDNIVLGNQTGDEFNAGTVAFRTFNDASGLVEINEDSSTNVGGVNRAKTLRIISAGDITDGPMSRLNVAGNTMLKSGNNGRVVMGDGGTFQDGSEFDAAFETRTLTVQTDGTGNARIEEDGDIILKGENRANSMTLVTRGAEGKILDAPEARIAVRYNLSVEGSLINLGTDILPNGTSTDQLEFGTLTFTSTGNVKISADDSFFLIGSSSTGGFLTLESEGDIRTAGGSELLSQTGAQFDGMDILVGNLVDDCFDIHHSNEDGSKRLTVNGQGTEDVQLGCEIVDDFEQDS